MAEQGRSDFYIAVTTSLCALGLKQLLLSLLFQIIRLSYQVCMLLEANMVTLLRCRAINSITFFLSIFCETRDLKRLQSHKINTRKSFEICCVYSSPSTEEQGVLHDPKSDPRIRWSGPPITCCTIFAVLPYYELY